MGGGLRGAAAVGLLLAACLEEAHVPPPTLERELVSPAYLIDREYRSMEGPKSTAVFALGDFAAPELLWITGYRAVMVGEDGETPMPQEFMCHSNLDFDPQVHRKVLESQPGVSPRLFTLSQGQLEIDLPPGFGIPVFSSEKLSLTTQVLNLNGVPEPVLVRHKVSIEYVRESELTTPLKPLFQKAVYGLKLLDGRDGHYGIAASEEAEGESCLPGENLSHRTLEDGEGRSFTDHWVVEPGREVNHTRVTEILNLPYDTTVHYIAVHLHPFAESLELRDLSDDAVVFRSRARGRENGIGLDSIEYFSSVEGLRLHDDHEYEVVSVYDNTSGEPQDSMAVMYMYLLDKRFEPPDAKRRRRAAKL